MKEIFEKYRSLFIVAGMTIGMFLGLLAFGYFDEWFFPERIKQNLENSITNSVREINEQCPIPINENTKLVRATNMGDMTIGYYYRMDVNVIATDTAAIRKRLSAGLLASIKRNEQIDRMKQHNVNFKYHYADSNEVQMFQIHITPEMYKAE